MKAHLAKLSLALLSTVFLLGCQEQGSEPVGPEGPQFNKPVPVNDANEALCEDQGGFIFDEKGHCHAGEVEPPADPLPEFSITIVSVQIPVTIPQVFETSGMGILVDPFVLDLSFFDGVLGCNMGIKTGHFTMTKGDADGPHVHVGFGFTHNGSEHHLGIPGVPVPLENNDWDPTIERVAEESPDGFGVWGITAKGKNHRNGCTGEDDGAPGGGDDLSYRITVTPTG